MSDINLEIKEDDVKDVLNLSENKGYDVTRLIKTNY